jgi:hypothetical protein
VSDRGGEGVYIPVITDLVPSTRDTPTERRFQYGEPMLSGFS